MKFKKQSKKQIKLLYRILLALVIIFIIYIIYIILFNKIENLGVSGAFGRILGTAGSECVDLGKPTCYTKNRCIWMKRDDDLRCHDIINNIVIQKYVKRLFKYLGDDYCFVSGAFVIDDQDNKLFEMLQGAKKTRPPMESHTSFKNPPYHRETGDEYNMYETLFTNPIEVSCTCPSTVDDQRQADQTKIFKIIKWYKFINIDGDHSFIYMKPESEPTISMSHLLGAANRYGRGITNTSCRDARREDCIRDNNCQLTQTPEALAQTGLIKNYTNIIKQDESTEEIIETYTRVGDELFIPQTISNHIILSLQNENDIIFSYEQGNSIKLI